MGLATNPLYRGTPNKARYRLHHRSTWLDLYRNETKERLFRLVRSWPRRKNDDDSAQREQWGWLLALPEDDEIVHDD